PAGGASFGNEQHVAGSFNMLAAPNAGGFFLGDYQALATAGGRVPPPVVSAKRPGPPLATHPHHRVPWSLFIPPLGRRPAPQPPPTCGPSRGPADTAPGRSTRRS